MKAHDLIASPAFIVIKAADAFKDTVDPSRRSARKLTERPSSLPRKKKIFGTPLLQKCAGSPILILRRRGFADAADLDGQLARVIKAKVPVGSKPAALTAAQGISSGTTSGRRPCGMSSIIQSRYGEDSHATG